MLSYMKLLGKNWRKIKLSEKKPILKKGRLKLRKCISCGKMFKSTGPGNRFCIVCKSNVDKENRHGSEKSEPGTSRRNKVVS